MSDSTVVQETPHEKASEGVSAWVPSPTVRSFLAWHAKQHRASQARTVHPRRDRVRIERIGETVVILTGYQRPERTQYVLLPAAKSQLLDILGIPVGLLERLERLDRDEDVRLLNILLWDRGRDEEAVLHWDIEGNKVQRIGASVFQPLDPAHWRQTLEAALSSGRLDIIRWDSDADMWHLYLGLGPAEAGTSRWSAPARVGDAREADLWQPVLWIGEMMDSAGGALQVQSGWIRQWGRHWLPEGSATRLRHAEGLEQQVWKEVEQWRARARRTLEPQRGAGLAALSALRIGRPLDWISRLEGWSEPQRQALLGQAQISGPASGYRLVTAALRTAYTVPSLRRRAALLRSIPGWVDRLLSHTTTSGAAVKADTSR